MTIPVPIVLQTVQPASIQVDSVISAVLRSPRVVSAASFVKSTMRAAKAGRSTVPGQLSIAPWLGSPNGTTEEFLFIQSLDAGGRRGARLTSIDASLLDAKATYNETLKSVYVTILTQCVQLLLAQRAADHALLVEKNLAESMRVIEAQVNAGTKPGSDLELAKAVWNEARIDTVLASEKVMTLRTSLQAYGISNGDVNLKTISRVLPELRSLHPDHVLEGRADANIAKLIADKQSVSASGRPDVSMVVRSQNFTRNFTPNDRGIALQLSIPVDHGTIRANAATFDSQIGNVERRLEDESAKQKALRISIEANIASIDSGIIASQQKVIAPLSDYVSKMQRAYAAGTVNVVTFLDAQRAYHSALGKLLALQDRRDMAVLQLVEQGGMIPRQFTNYNQQSDKK